MNPKALKAVLQSLSKSCYDDMADSSSSPDEKVEDAIKMADDPGDEMEEDDMEDATVDDALADEDEEPQSIQDVLRDFMRPKGKEAEPGTAVMIATEKKKPMPPFGKGKGFVKG